MRKFDGDCEAYRLPLIEVPIRSSYSYVVLKQAMSMRDGRKYETLAIKRQFKNKVVLKPLINLLQL